MSNALADHQIERSRLASRQGEPLCSRVSDALDRGVLLGDSLVCELHATLEQGSRLERERAAFAISSLIAAHVLRREDLGMDAADAYWRVLEGLRDRQPSAVLYAIADAALHGGGWDPRLARLGPLAFEPIDLARATRLQDGLFESFRHEFPHVRETSPLQLLHERHLPGTTFGTPYSLMQGLAMMDRLPIVCRMEHSESVPGEKTYPLDLLQYVTRSGRHLDYYPVAAYLNLGVPAVRAATLAHVEQLLEAGPDLSRNELGFVLRMHLNGLSSSRHEHAERLAGQLLRPDPAFSSFGSSMLSSVCMADGMADDAQLGSIAIYLIEAGGAKLSHPYFGRFLIDREAHGAINRLLDIGCDPDERAEPSHSTLREEAHAHKCQPVLALLAARDARRTLRARLERSDAPT